MATPPDTAFPLPDQPVVAGEPGPVLVVSDTDGPQTMQRRLWFLLPLTLLSISIVWGGVLTSLIALQVADFVPDRTAQAGVLGVVLTVAAIISVICTPILGRLSDRTRTRFLGRRNIWILGGSVVGAIGIVITGLSPSVIVLAIVWSITIIPLNGAQGAAAAVVPERVPLAIRGRLSAINGVAALIGVAGGAVIGLLVTNHAVAYAIIGIQLVVVCAVFAFFTRDAVPAALVAGAKPEKSDLLKFRKYPDFWRVFVGRFLAFVAYGLATGLQLYALRDHFNAVDPKAAAATAQSLLVLPLIVSAIIGGVLADKFGRVKPFVIGASALFIPAGLVLAFVPSVTGNLIGIAILGFGFGSYISVDGVLITRVLPRLEDAGKDLGVLNIANAGPQVITPVIAGALVSLSGYTLLYIVVIVAALGASIAVGLVKGVR